MIERAGYQDLIDSCYVIRRLGLEMRSLKLINIFHTSFIFIKSKTKLYVFEQVLKTNYGCKEKIIKGVHGVIEETPEKSEQY